VSQPQRNDDLQKMLAIRTAAAVANTRRADGDVPAVEIESLERLARLLQLQKVAGETPPRRSWQVAAILFTTLFVVSVLLFAHVDKTEIELETDATHVSFLIETEQVLFEQVDLNALGVSGLSKVTLPDPIAAAFGGRAVIEEPDQSIRLSVAEINGRRGAIGISEIKPTKATAVDVRWKGPNGQYRLSLQNPGMTFDIGVLGPVRVTIPGLGSQTIELPIPQSLALEPTQGVDLDMTFRDLEHAEMTAQVPVSMLEFWRVDEFGDRRLSVLRTLSTILRGTIYFEALDGVSRSLRAGEVLRFAHVHGEVRTLRMRDDRLSLGFHGQVEGMSTGIDQRIHSLMPTWLDWLKAQHGLSLLWGTTLYVTGLAFAALRWFKGAQ
jgi:hypothetical protein